MLFKTEKRQTSLSLYYYYYYYNYSSYKMAEFFTHWHLETSGTSSHDARDAAHDLPTESHGTVCFEWRAVSTGAGKGPA